MAIFYMMISARSNTVSYLSFYSLSIMKTRKDLRQNEEIKVKILI